MPKRPRPAKDAGPRKHRGVRFSDAEWAELEAAASREEMPSVASFIRQAAMRAARRVGG